MKHEHNRAIQIIYYRVVQKHPEWSMKQVWVCVDWCCKKNKIIRRYKNAKN